MAQRPRMRPRFRIPVAGDGSAVLEQLRRQLEAPDASLCGQVVRCHAFLQAPTERHSFLSPFLNLELDGGPEGTFLVGRFSPAPNVWTGFMAIYIFLGLMAFVYGAAVIGQGLTADEMYELRAFVDRAVEKAG